MDNSNLILKGYNHFVKCSASYERGVIYSYAATASLTGNNTFESNTATSGGGVHAHWSNMSITVTSKFEKNNAVFGGGITLTAAPLNSITPPHLVVIRLIILVVVYMPQTVF